MGTATALFLLSTALVSGGTALAASNADDKQLICHAKSDDKKAYVMVTAAKDGDASGHADQTGPIWNAALKAGHDTWGDIIPPFDYTENGVVKHFPGLNWNAVGQAWFGNLCSAPPALSLTVEKTNDADGDGSFSPTETATAAAADVDFVVVITNTSDVPVRIDSLTDAVGASSVPFTCADAVIGTTLAAGGVATCAFTAADYSPVDGGSVTNTVKVAAHQAVNGAFPDNPANGTAAQDTSTVRTDVPDVDTTAADLSVVKTGPDEVSPGDSLTWTVTVTNDGDAPASGVVAADDLPADVTFTSAGGSGWSCLGTTSISCTLDAPLAAGDHATLTVVGQLADDYGSDSLSNTVTVGPTDATPANNSSTATTDVTAAPVDPEDPVDPDDPQDPDDPEDPDQNGGGGSITPDGTPVQTPAGKDQEFTGGGGSLAFTGAPISEVALAAVALLLAGSALVMAGRRRTLRT